MTRGEAQLTKVHYQGSEEDFLIFVDDVDTYKKWKTDPSIPMSEFMGNFTVYITHRQGAEGQYDTASKGTLENEFNTKNSDDIIKIILEKGMLQNYKEASRQGDRNINSGPRIAH